MEMTEYEICQNYKEAKDKSEQINILADLNLCSSTEIVDVLKRGGMITGLKQKKGSGRGKWTTERLAELQEYINNGDSYDVIAERMGETRKSIGAAVYMHRLRGCGRNNNHAEKSKTDENNNEIEIPEEKLADVQSNADKVRELESALRFKNMTFEDIGAACVRILDLCRLLDCIDENLFDDALEVARVVCDNIKNTVGEVQQLCEDGEK